MLMVVQLHFYQEDELQEQQEYLITGVFSHHQIVEHGVNWTQQMSHTYLLMVEIHGLLIHSSETQEVELYPILLRQETLVIQEVYLELLLVQDQ